VGGDRNRLVVFQEFSERGELKEGDDLVDYHEPVVPDFGNVESLAHRPYPRRGLITKAGVVIGKKFQVRAFSRSACSVKNEQPFLLKGLVFQPEKVVKPVDWFVVSSHALKNSF